LLHFRQTVEQSFEEEKSMEHDADQNLEALPVRFTIGGMTGEVIVWPERNDEGSFIAQLTIPPNVGKFLVPLHRHATQERNEIISGRARVTHGSDDPLETTELGPGDHVLVEAHEWHGLSNLSPQEDLVIRQTQTPGSQWAQMVRIGAEQIRKTGQLSPDFQKWYFEYLGIEFQERGNGTR
jgi:mannose-6-phosphate isomerase-like protein (cupin superfamily)